MLGPNPTGTWLSRSMILGKYIKVHCNSRPRKIIILCLFRRRAHILREQVSSEGLKSMINFKKSAENETSPSPTSTSPTPPSSASLRDLQPTGELSLSTFMGNSPKDPLSSQKTVPIVYSEDKSNDTKKNDMEAMAACTKDDVLFRNWLIRFINSQMLMKGTYFPSNAQVFLYLHSIYENSIVRKERCLKIPDFWREKFKLQK